MKSFRGSPGEQIKKAYKYTISQTKKREKLLEKGIMDILEAVAQDTVHKIQVFITQYWYNKYHPLDYNRTGYLKSEAVKYEIDKNKRTIRIYMDFDGAQVRSEHGWGSYTNFKGEASFDDDDYQAFAYYINDGNFRFGKTGVRSNPRIGDGIDFITKTQNWLDKYLDTRVKDRIQAFFDSIDILY